jgi:hypothetical protein
MTFEQFLRAPLICLRWPSPVAPDSKMHQDVTFFVITNNVHRVFALRHVCTVVVHVTWRIIFELYARDNDEKD